MWNNDEQYYKILMVFFRLLISGRWELLFSASSMDGYVTSHLFYKLIIRAKHIHVHITMINGRFHWELQRNCGEFRIVNSSKYSTITFYCNVYLSYECCTICFILIRLSPHTHSTFPTYSFEFPHILIRLFPHTHSTFPTCILKSISSHQIHVHVLR